jgi:hypothetical protein
MEEENFPTRSPTRDAVEREMDEPGNLQGSHPIHRKPREKLPGEVDPDEA